MLVYIYMMEYYIIVKSYWIVEYLYERIIKSKVVFIRSREFDVVLFFRYSVKVKKILKI